MTPRDRCFQKIAGLKRDDVVTVGKARWRVERAYGGTVYVVKDGSKGKKLYTIRATEIEPRCCVEIREVFPGSGDLKPDVTPAARGCATNGEGWTTLGQRR